MATLIDPLLIPVRPVVSRHVVRPVAHVHSAAARRAERVYRRRRIAVVLVAVFLTASGFLATSAVADNPTTGNVSVPHTVIAQRGDNLWVIARRLAPTGDITALVEELVRLNGDQLAVGQLVRIP